MNKVPPRPDTDAPAARPAGGDEDVRNLDDHIERLLAERTAELEEARRQAKAAARSDWLTGLGNRRAFEEDLDAELALARRHEYPVGLLVMDLDGLKAVNDAHGHHRGDALLRALAAEARRVLRREDRLYRLGGDEFAVVLPHLTPEGFDAIRNQVEAVLAAVRAGGFPGVDVSVGLAVCPLEAGDGEALVRLADARMYREKRGHHDVRALADAGREEAGPLWATLRSTLALLTRDEELSDEGWAALIEAAVAALAGAETGSLYVRDGEHFVLRAQVGFSDELLGLSQTEAEAVIWHGGDEAAWRSGRPRVLVGAAIADCSRSASDPVSFEAFEQFAPLETLKSTLCVPVILDGVVVALLNLDSLSSQRAFPPGASLVAVEFAAQVTAVLAAQARRSREATRVRELECLISVTAALRTAVTEDETTAIVTRQAQGLLGAEHAVFMRHDPASDVLRPVAPLGLYAAVVQQSVLPRGAGLSWAALAAHRALKSESASRDPRVNVLPGMGRETLLAVPAQTQDGRPLGVLLVARDHQHPFSDLDLRLAEAVVSAGVAALERRAFVRDIQATQEGALLALGMALEARDFETLGHTERVVKASVALGQTMGLPGSDLDALRQGAYLHDVGKLSIPDAILLKPGRLDPGEWATMQTHAVLGFDVASGIPTLPELARLVVRHHHERWDGAGYPDGLAGEAIPLAARVFSVVDVYDALVSTRPYKRAWSAEEALAEVVAQAGRQFDPAVVRAFVEAGGH